MSHTHGDKTWKKRERIIESCTLCDWKGTQIALHWNETHPEEPMPEKCDKCSFRTCTKNNLLNHIKNNHSGNFYCTLCDYSCHNKLTFDEHVKRIHNPKNLILKKRIFKKRPLVQKCSICPWSGTALNQHWKDEHPKVEFNLL